MKQEFNRPSRISKNIRTIIIAILATAIIVGGSIYVWQQACAKKQIEQLH